MDESFNFSILRISIAQILKASGFDKCKPSILNILTDLYLHYFKQLLKQAVKFSETRIKSNQIEVQDVLQSMLSVEFIRPSSFESYLSFNDVPKYNFLRDKNSNLFKNYNTKSIESFVEWIKYSDVFKVSKRLSDVPNDLIKNLIEKRKIDTDDTNEADKKKKKYKEKQDFYNHFKLNDNQDSDGDLDEDLLEDEISKADKLGWLNYLIEKDLKLGHDMKFANSTLFEEFLKFQNNPNFHPINNDQQFQNFQTHLLNLNKNDHILLNIDEENEETVRPSNDLMRLVPYNLKYDKTLIDDDIEQYIVYANKRVSKSDDQLNDNILINDEGIDGDHSLMLL